MSDPSEVRQGGMPSDLRHTMHHESSVQPSMEHDITDGGPDMVQFVDAEGTRLETNATNAPYAQIVEDMTSEDARRIYRDLVLVRRIDAEGFALQRQGELDQQIAIVERRVERFRKLATSGAVAQTQLDDAVAELKVVGPSAPSWSRGPRRASDGRGPRDTYG